MLSDALDAIPEHTPAKQARLDAMEQTEQTGTLPETYDGAGSAGSATLDYRKRG